MHFGALAGGLGSFPFDDEAYPPPSDCWGTGIRGIRSLIGFGNLVGSLSHPVLYLRDASTRLPLKAFRGERAITEFD